MTDAHLHLQDPVFEESLEEIAATLRKEGVRRWVVNGTSPDDWNRVGELSERYGEVVPFYAVHPWRIDGLANDWELRLREVLEASADAGVGETGLDRWIRPRDPARQREVFLAHLKIAREYRRVLSIHCLRAWGSLLECLESDPPDRPFLLHSYSGPRELVSRFAELGGFFSLSGYFFRPDKEAKLAVFAAVPEDRTLLETDAPDMAPPDSMRSYRIAPSPSWETAKNGNPTKAEPNHPANLVAVYQAYAWWKGLSLEEATALVSNNATAWLGITPAR